jgi:hypothetical protein
MSPEQFAKDHWGRTPLVTTAADLPEPVGDIFSEDAVDELVSLRGLRAPFLRVAKDGRTLGDREFTQGGGVGAAVGDQVSDDKLLRLFAGGATIVLQGLHRTWGPLIEFTQTLAGELGHPVQANAYVTPSQNTGFSDHYDVHDVFVIQVSGEKQWRLRPPVREAPLRDDPWTDHRSQVDEATTHAPSHEFTLRAGDVLYLPRGWLHSATALGGVSTHLTLGVHVWTRRHLADELVALATARVSEDDAMRTALAPSADLTRSRSLSDDVEVARAALVRALETVSVEDVAAALDRRARATQRAAPIGPLRQVAAAQDLAPDTGLRVRDHVVARLVPMPDGSASLESRVGTMPVAPDEVGAVVALLDGGVLRADMAGMDLARRLMLAGMVVSAD